MAYDGLNREIVKPFANGMELTQTFDTTQRQTVRQYLLVTGRRQAFDAHGDL